MEKYKNIEIFFKKEMSVKSDTGYSPSPSKPHRFMNYLVEHYDEYDKYFSINQNFKPFTNEEFYLVHSKKYVGNFFKGKDRTNSLDWSKELAESVRYTNSSLWNAIKHSIYKPNKISLSPTSGFHHATHERGGGFCTFSGQVLASLRIYREWGKRGCYIDLDGHFGNSIESYRDLKGFNDVNKAIPEDCNINPNYTGIRYLKDLMIKLETVKHKYLNNEIDYFVWCHGADSCKEDPLGTQLSHKHWVHCTQLFIEMIKEIMTIKGDFVPITICLFGGYQKNFNKTLELHRKDINVFIEELL